MSIGITPELEDGVCSVCGKTLKVRVIVDNSTARDAGICESCAASSSLTAEELLEKFGSENAGDSKVPVLDKQEWLSQQKQQPPQQPA